MTNRAFKTGESRDQANLLPPRIEDYVGPDNPVRAIESFVSALDLAKFGFRHADRGVEVGQPPYDPADLLKLYLYGYINQVRSSRRLEREACRNLELIWLLKDLKPGYRTIANFRKENWKALKAVNRSFVLLARELGLVGGSLVAIDGALFHGDASKASIFTRRRLAEQIATLDREIEAYGKSLEDNDATEAEPRPDGHGDAGHGDDLGARVKELMAKRSRAQADLEGLDTGEKRQLSLTDPDARLLSKGDQTIAGRPCSEALRQGRSGTAVSSHPCPVPQGQLGRASAWPSAPLLSPQDHRHGLRRHDRRVAARLPLRHCLQATCRKPRSPCPGLRFVRPASCA